MALWTGLGQAATVAQLVGADVGGLISMIVQAAQTARHNRSECEKLAQRVLMIGQLLPHVQVPVPEAAQPLAGLGDTLRDAHELVVSCQGRSVAYQFFMASRTAERFREVQSKIDFYLSLIPLISHIGITRGIERISNVLVPDDSTRVEPSPLPLLQEFEEVAQEAPPNGTQELMLTMTMAVSASTGVMNSLLGKLSTLMTDEYRKIKGVRNKVVSLHEEFSSINALLVKLAGMDVLDGHAKVWRDQVREMSYDIEDCIDDFMHDLEIKGATTGFLKKTGERLKKLKVRHQIGNKIQKIQADVLAVNERRKRYKLDEYTPASSIVPVDPRALAIYSDAAGLVGIDAPRDEILELLMDQDQELKVASIVGFGGLGKTTLANEVRRKIEGQFTCHAFVSVSLKPDIQSLLQNLFFKLTQTQSPHNSKLDDVIDSIRKYLLNKRYFVIIDDLWDSLAWEAIKCAFPENNNGSRLLTTTRIHSVAAACCSKSRGCVYKMRSLNNQDSRKLFFSRIFGSGEPCPGELEELSMDILKKCGGLPLAIASVSSLLADQPKSTFEYVRNSLGFIFGGNPSLEQMKKILELSYRNLPHHLKACLLYLGMYPEDREIGRVDLLRQWIAESFVTANSSLDVEDVALSYFNELINWNMIQPVYSKMNNTDEVVSCRVHDIILEVIRSKIEEENFIVVVNDPKCLLEVHGKIRRVSLQCSGKECTVTPAMVNGSLSQVRSIVVFGGVSCPAITMLKYVRVLHLHIGVDRDEVEDLTGLPELFLLRYLTIRSFFSTRLKLPSQIGKLQQLETLDLECCSCKLPSDILSLPRLLHLIVGESPVFPDGIGRLTSLRSLRGFDLGKNSVENIEGLGMLTNLREFGFRWTGDDLVEGTRRMDVLRSSLERISGSLRSLTMLGGYQELDGWSTFSPPPIHLQEMSMSGCVFSRMPTWIAHLRDLQSLNLNVSGAALNDEGVAIFAGLPSLVHLSLLVLEAPEERVVIPGSGMAFRALKKLELYSPDMLLTIEEGAMPRLQELMFRLFRCERELGGSANCIIAGIEHLPACLKKISIEIFGKVAAVKSSLKRAFEEHHPAADLQIP